MSFPGLFFLVFVIINVILSAKKARAFEREPRKPAIVLAAFGTTQKEALSAIFNIRERIKISFSQYDVHLAFTSNMIRSRWHKRAIDTAFKNNNPDIDEEIYGIGNVISVLARLQEEGARPVLVQSLHVTDGEEYQDVRALVKALSGIKTFQPSLNPFPAIALGEPALGEGDGREVYLKRAALALAPLVLEAKKKKAALVLMGHGNENITQKVYGRLEKIIRSLYWSEVYIGTVEAHPSGDDVVKALGNSKEKIKKVILAPLMVVAGDHAKNDMAGDSDDSWAGLLRGKGFEVEIRLIGLGANNSWADIYVEHLKVAEKKLEKI